MTSGDDLNKPLVRVEKIREMLFNEEQYVIEFAEASIESFSDFSSQYGRFLLDRDRENLRKAGHKIKPVAQILELDQLLAEYRKAKKLLAEDGSESELQQSVDDVEELCDRVINEFQAIINKLI